MSHEGLTIEAVTKPQKGTLDVGLEVAGGVVKDFAVGPLTDEGEVASLGALPDWIDPALVEEWRHGMGVKLKLVEAPKGHKPLSQKDARRAALMYAAWRRTELRYRVTYLGGVPPDRIPEAVSKLDSGDIEKIQEKAAAIDAALFRLRQKNETDLDEAIDNELSGVTDADDVASGPTE